MNAYEQADLFYTRAMLGQNGAKYISNTSATTPATGYIFMAVQVIADAVITAVGDYNLTSVSMLAGTTFYGRFTSITLASGSVIAYQGA